MSDRETMRLSDRVRLLLDGTSLDEKIGMTFLVAATSEDRWPRVATLSVGEVLAPQDNIVLLMMWRSSRTTAAIVASGRAVLLVVDDGAIVRIMLDVEPVASGIADKLHRSMLRGSVVTVERDAVPYARVVDTIRYELTDTESTLQSWRRQLDGLRAVAT